MEMVLTVSLLVSGVQIMEELQTMNNDRASLGFKIMKRSEGETSTYE